MTRVAIFAAVGLALVVPAASAARALVATPGSKASAVAATTTSTTTTDTTTSTRAVVTTTTAVSPTHVMRPKPIPRPAVTTTTSNFAKLAAKRAHALGVCLTRAAGNNYLAVAANRTWFRRQLRALVGRPKLAAARSGALQIEEDQAQAEMQAQYAIDQSNCYLKHG